MSQRIQINKENNELEITIRAFYDTSKQKVLLSWIVLFSLCGLAILTQFFEDYDAGTKVFFGVYLAFWLFFEFKVIYAFRWRKMGEEKIKVDKEQVVLIKTIGKRGITQRFGLDEVKSFEIFKDANGDFVKSMTTSYWNINKYHLVLKLKSSEIPFAIDIDQKDAKKLLYTINSFIN